MEMSPSWPHFSLFVGFFCLGVLALTKQFGTFFSFSIHERHPTVVHLAIHLENGQCVYFTTQKVLQQAI